MMADLLFFSRVDYVIVAIIDRPLNSEIRKIYLRYIRDS